MRAFVKDTLTPTLSQWESEVNLYWSLVQRRTTSDERRMTSVTGREQQIRSSKTFEIIQVPEPAALAASLHLSSCR